MDHERGTIGGIDLARWAIVALLIGTGIGLFFMYGKSARPVVEPSVAEGER